MQPGDAILTGQVDGRQLGKAVLQFLPCFPGEGPPLMPRGMAKQLFPGGFLRQPAVVPPVVPPVVAPPVAPPAQPPGNGPAPRAAPPAPKRVLERGSFPAWH